MRISIVSGSSREGRRSHRVALGLGNQIEAVDHKAVIIDLMQLELPPFVERFGNVDDPNFGEKFLGIWLSPKTTRPKIRREMLGNN